MSMFDNYDNLSKFYVPNNISQNPAKEYDSIDNNIMPKKLYDLKNRFIGYSWDYGNTFDLTLSVNSKIPVKRDSIIFSEPNITPTTETAGYKGLQAYNTIDNKSWTCVGTINGLYVWVEDDEVTYAIDGTTIIEMIRDCKDKEIRVDFYDFRWEPVKSFTTIDSNTIVCRIDDTLESGLYYCTVKLLGTEECELINKFTVSIN